MTKKQIAFVKQCIADNNLHAFYTCSDWEKLRKEVLEADKYECQRCKSKGKYTKANTVHHDKHVREYPELALEKHYIDQHGNKQRQLISVCNDCHEKEHPNRFNKPKAKKLLTVERW